MKQKEILDLLNARYTTKVYDRSKKVSNEDIEVLVESLRLAPSSMGLQPWHFFVVSSEEMLQSFSEVALGDNEKKVRDCSHLFVLAAKKRIDKAHLEKYADSMDKARGTHLAEIIKNRYGKYLKLLKFGWLVGRDNEKNYHRQQVYLALGFLTYTAGLLGVQSTILGGMNFRAVDRILGLRERGLRSVVAVSVGYASSEEPKEAKIKVRFPKEDVVTYL